MQWRSFKWFDKINRTTLFDIIGVCWKTVCSFPCSWMTAFQFDSSAVFFLHQRYDYIIRNMFRFSMSQHGTCSNNPICTCMRNMEWQNRYIAIVFDYDISLDRRSFNRSSSITDIARTFIRIFFIIAHIMSDKQQVNPILTTHIIIFTIHWPNRFR